ncbi:MAG: hypothetical protein KA371_04380 [Acidobacteria bacterium]|nr:hypothetical protein [Acidobacteriota bacterium]
MASTETTCTCPVETPARSLPAVACCGGPAPPGTPPGCALDAHVKAAGGAGRGGGTPAPALAAPGRAPPGCC